MYSYKADGPVLVITVSGDPDQSQRQAVFDAVRSDPKVPDGAMVVLDVRQFATLLSPSEVRLRAQKLVDGLRPKLGPACALIVSDISDVQANLFRTIAADMNLRVGVFCDQESARRWLERNRERP
jgi:hypothetical protein